MNDPAAPGDRAKLFFDDIWKGGDLWSLETSPFEAAKYARQVELLSDRRYESVLEIGCGSGVFSRMLAPISRRILALDVSAAAIDRAREKGTADGVIEFRQSNALEFEPERHGPYDLVVISETIYYLGWLYTFFEVGWFAATIFDATLEDGRLLMTNTIGTGEDRLHSRWLLLTYRDLFLNVGYRLDLEAPFRGAKDGVEISATIARLEKPPGAARVAI